MLEQRLKYDRLGVNDALRQFENDLGKRALPEPERLLPVLDRIAADSRVVEGLGKGPEHWPSVSVPLQRQ
jgi:hypothetical protein